VTLKMPAFEWVHVQLHQQKGMISLSPPTICNSALRKVFNLQDRRVIQKDSDFSYDQCNAEPYVSALAAAM
ncbi:hypothetical protein, partial [Kluyvera ascorbata]|uniref:hypothetical protein n=1 Tax=Kluyvera ascorbata TaxID=51288 RepID=UPI0039F6B5C8